MHTSMYSVLFVILILLLGVSFPNPPSFSSSSSSSSTSSSSSSFSPRLVGAQFIPSYNQSDCESFNWCDQCTTARDCVWCHNENHCLPGEQPSQLFLPTSNPCFIFSLSLTHQTRRGD